MTDLERALARAQKAGLQVVGVGKQKTTGRQVYAVPSLSQPNRLHLVWVDSGHLKCDCLGCQHGKVCIHRAIVWAYLQELAEELKRAQKAAEAAMKAKRERSTRAVNNAPIGIFK